MLAYSICLIVWTPWELLYTKKYIKGNKEEEAGFESDNISNNSPTPEGSSSDDGSPEQVEIEIEQRKTSILLTGKIQEIRLRFWKLLYKSLWASSWS